jgi:uncharacterized protein (DUF305 family)
VKLKHPAAFAAIAAIALAGCGSEESRDGAGSGTSATAGNGVDRAFAEAMIPHHESAVEMAQIAQERGESEFVTQLADDIVRTQNEEIETLRAQDAELEEAGVEPGELGLDHDTMGIDDDPAMLQDADPFDAEFIDMMIPHHEGAIAMANVELEQGKNPELKALAQDIVDAQQREIAEMREHVDAPDDDGDMHHSG